MNQNGKSNVNLSNSTDIGVKLSDKGGQVGPTGSTVSAKDSKNDSIWNQNQNNKHNKAKSNNNEDESKKSSKSEIDPSKSKSNQNGSSPSDSASVGGVGGNSNIIKLADVKSKNKIGGVSGGKANTTGQSNGPSSNPRAAPLSQSHPASAQQQRETKQNTQTAQNNAQPNHLTTALKTAKKQTIFHKEKSDHADIGITTAGKSGGTNNTKEKTLESNAAVEHKQNSKTASAGNLANSKQGRRESQDDATAQQKSKQEKTTKEVGTITEPECLAPCDTGTEVHLSGIIWHESESGMLVVNVTWRNRSYVGTLLDASRHDWAPPRLVDGESDGSSTSRGKRNNRGARNLVDQAGGRNTRGRSRVPEPPNNSSPHLTGRKGKRDAETNSDVENGKSAPKKPRTNGRATTPQNDSADGNSCDSPAPVSGWYNCKVTDCQKKFKRLEALNYHVEDHRKKNSDEDMDVDSESGKKSKTEKTKPDGAPTTSSTSSKSKQNGKSSSASATVEGDNSKESKDGDNKTTGKDGESGKERAEMSVAQSLLDLKNDSKLEKDGTTSSATGPPSLTLPPSLKRPVDGSTEKPGTNPPQNQSMPTLIHYPKQSPQSASALPPMPILTPKPGLLQSVPSPGPKRTNPSSPIPDQGKISPSQNISSQSNNDIVSSPNLAQSTGGNAHEQPPKLERRPTSPFQPVKPDPGSPNAAQQNARVSPAYSDISDAGDENIVNPKPKGEDKDPKKEELQSSLNYYQNQYGAYEQHQNIINSFTQLNRDEKKEAADGRKEDAKTDIKSTQPQEFKSEFKSTDKADSVTPSPRVQPINPSSSRPKPHQAGMTESNKPTATIQPEPRKSEPKTPQSAKQSLPPKKEITPSSSPAPVGIKYGMEHNDLNPRKSHYVNYPHRKLYENYENIKKMQPSQAAGMAGVSSAQQNAMLNSVYPAYDYRIPLASYPTPIGAYPTVPYHSVPSIVQVPSYPIIPPPVSASYAPSIQPPQSHLKSHEKQRLGMDSKSASHRDNRAVSPSIHSSMHPKHATHPMHSIQQAHLPGYPMVHPSYPSYGQFQNSSKK